MKLRRFAISLMALLLSACAPDPPVAESTASGPGIATGEESPAADSITGAELAARLGGEDAPLVLDVRTPGEFADGHIPGALNIPHTELAERLDELPTDRSREIVVHCRSGRRALTAEEVLLGAGYERVRDLNGHMLAWADAGLPVARERQ